MKALFVVALVSLLAACAESPPPAVPSNAPNTSATAAPAGVPGTPDAKQGAAATVASGKSVKPIGQAVVGDTTKCPVSGEDFEVTASTPKHEFQGKTYYTCCAGCMKKFSADPAKYLTKPAS